LVTSFLFLRAEERFSHWAAWSLSSDAASFIGPLKMKRMDDGVGNKKQALSVRCDFERHLAW
jgi:hypothetical protein